MVNFTAEDEELTENTAGRCRIYMEKALGPEERHRVLAPKVDTHFKGKDSVRRYIIIKSPKGQRNQMVYYLETFRSMILKETDRVTINLDINPYSIF